MTADERRLQRVRINIRAATRCLDEALLDMQPADPGSVQVRASATALHQLLDHDVVRSSQASETAELEVVK